ncbi:MAG: endolytic transglycosylase MltG [Oscillospiraceae bacterium]|nr:endolytic transglycosylase MltG [Oscillospiraceae bacterium]
MSNEKDVNLNSSESSLEELLRDAKENIESGAPTAFEPDLPAEYADLVSDEDPEEAPMGKEPLPPVLKGVLYGAIVLAISIVLAVLAWKCVDEVCALTAVEEIVTVTVEETDTMGQLAKKLKDSGLIKYRWLFNMYCMASDAEEKIDPGTYELNTIYDYHALVYSMMETSENRATVEVTIPEGYEAEDIFRMLEENAVCSVADLEEAAANYEFDYWFLEDLEYGDYRRLEGYLFPDTYEFYVDDTPENVLARFLRNFDNKLSDEMKQDLDTLNKQLREQKLAEGFTEAEIRDLTIHDMIIVASLVEKETTGDAESGKIASVIYNRLCSRVYPCLNIDATIQYVLPERKDILSNADKAVISPYNTYTNAGLPVGPISNPGISSIRAALYPVDTDYYFYALDPAGGHYFSEDVYEHQAFLDSLTGVDRQAESEEETTDEQE